MRNKEIENEKLKKLRGERLKACLDRYDLKQVDITRDGICKESEVSDWVNGKRLLTEAKITDIQQAYFPEIRKDYLLGDSEYMTYQEEFSTKVDFDNIVADSMWAIIEKSLNARNMTLKFVHKNNGMHIDSFQRRFVDCWYEIRDFQNRLIKKLSVAEMIEFENKIQDYSDFIFSKYVE